MSTNAENVDRVPETHQLVIDALRRRVDFQFNRNPLKIINLPTPIRFRLNEWDDYLHSTLPAMKNADLPTALKMLTGTQLLDILNFMVTHLVGDRLYVQVDVKIQFLKKGYVGSRSTYWHLDGVPLLSPETITDLKRTYLDFYARDRLPVFPRYISFISSDVSRTEYMNRAIVKLMPWVVEAFQPLWFEKECQDQVILMHDPSTLVCYDGYTLHQATPAIRDGWRVHIRMAETNTRRPFKLLDRDELNTTYNDYEKEKHHGFPEDKKFAL